MPQSLVLGVNGQDGSYLAEALLRRGHQVTGVARDAAPRYIEPQSGFNYVSLDLASGDALRDLLNSSSFEQVYHFAAIHGSAGFEYGPFWAQMLAVNVSSLQIVLEHARLRSRNMRVVYAGSSKIFPAPLSGKIDEQTPAKGTCLYSIGKITSRNLLSYYRAQFGIPTTNLILFNHESIRRPPEYLMPTLARSVKAAQDDADYKTSVKTLDFWIDWSAADELMDIVADIGNKSEGPEFVMAFGRTWNGREAVAALFASQGLDWRRHIFPVAPRRDAGPFFEVNLDALDKAVGRRPRKDIIAIFNDILTGPRSGGPEQVGRQK